jgi:RHS repeat-associated protein
MRWGVGRSYASNGTGSTTQGNKWLNSAADTYLVQQGSNVSLLVNAITRVNFRFNSTTNTYAAPTTSYLSLTHDTTNQQFIITSQMRNFRHTFNDFSVTNTALRGKPKQLSTLHFNAQSKSGITYSYNTNGTISQLTSCSGQDYNIVFTYSAGLITQVQVKDASGNLLRQANYTYYQNVTSPSTDLGHTNDLVQVQMSRKATNDAPGTLSIVRYIQYRYDSSSHLKAVYRHSAIQRILTSTGLSSPTAILSKADSYGTPAVSSFANKSMTYYGSSPPSTTSVNTAFASGENLSTRYGGTNAIASGALATQTIGGCSSCSTGSVTKNYYYMTLANSATDQNQVVSLVVQDTQDSAGNPLRRKVMGFENSGRLLRKAVIQSPTSSSPTYWCTSRTFATSTGSTNLPCRMAQLRKPSAHTGVTSDSILRTFLNPYNGTSWANDTSTVNSASGQIHVYAYNSQGLRTDHLVKTGSGGTPYYLSASDYGDSVNTALRTAKYRYPTLTTSRTGGKQWSISYSFYDSAHTQISSTTKTPPVIATSQNGSGTGTTKSRLYDNLGRLRWTQNGEGYVRYVARNPVTGRIAYVAKDVNPSSPTTDMTNGSAGNWDSVSTAGASSNQPTRGASLPTPLARVAKTYYDSQGQRNQNTTASGNSNFTVRATNQVIQFLSWNSTTGQCQVPIQISNLNSSGQVTDQIAVRASYTAISTSAGAPTGFSTAPSQSDYVSWTHNTYDPNSGRLTYADQYFNIPASGSGTLSANFYRTVTQYDAAGRIQYTIQVIRGSVSTNRVEQVTQYVYDAKGRVIQTNQGVSGDLAANSQNMTDSYNVYPTLYTMSQTVYDNGGPGDGLVTKTRKFFGTSTTSYTGTNNYYTPRGHLRGTEPFYASGTTETPIGPFTVNDLDTAGRVISTATYTADPSWSAVLTGDGYTAYASTTSTNRASQLNTLYDDLGRVYQTQTYDIAPSSGTGSNYLVNNSFYDRNGHLVAIGSASGAGTETAYDGTGRIYQTRTVLALQSTPYLSGAYQYCAPLPNPSLSAMSGGDNGVVTMSHAVYDTNGNVIETDSFEDNHDDLVSTSAGINLTNNNDYVRRTVFSWYDALNRPIATADYGSGDTAAGPGHWTYASLPVRSSTAPTASSNSALVTLNAYNANSGLSDTLTDPSGITTKTFFDSLNRQVFIDRNFVSFNPSTLTGTGNPTDRVTQFIYDGPTRIQQLIAMDPNGDGNLSDNQVTSYLYEDPVNSNRRTSAIYPDSSDTTSAGTNQVKTQYNLDGSLNQMSDQRGVVLSYTYTNNRQPAMQSVTTLPSGVDGSVQSVVRTYDALNRVQNITSYGSAGGLGTVVNDLQYTYYNNTGKVTACYQSHSGAVNTSLTPSTQYSYDTSTTGSMFTSQLRLQTEVHPNGRTVFYDYGAPGSPYSQLSVIREIWDGGLSGTGLVVYDYNGAGGRLAIATYLQPSFKLDHFEGTSGTYAGLDRFGRVIDQYWTGFGGTSDVDRVRYGYDYASSRTYRQIDPAIYPTENLDQAYTFDSLHRLATSQIGTLSGTTISGTPVSAEGWTLDGQGNWANYVQQTSGTPTLTQSRTASPANEIAGVSATVGSTWATPAYDLAGNMTSIPMPSALTSLYTATYDAWNRLLSVSNGSTPIATYAYDGLGRRIVKGVYVGGSLDHNEHAYFNEQWQLLEVRKEVAGTQSPNPLQQYLWHPLYVDALLLRDYDALTAGSSTRYYYVFDGNYNVTAVTGVTGAPVERYTYSSYGTLSVLNGSFAPLTSGSQIGNVITFGGQPLDPDTGLYLCRARYLHPALGTWLSRDPSRDGEGGGNAYAFVSANPVTNLDPSGLAQICGPMVDAISWVDVVAGGNWALNLSANTPPPQYFDPAHPPGVHSVDTVGAFLSSKEFRNYQYIKLTIQCDNQGNRTDQSKSMGGQVGYTKIPYLGSFDEGVQGTPTVTETKTANCYEVDTISRFRIGKLGNTVGRYFLAGYWAPWAWSEVRYKICCDGKVTLTFGGSYVPSAYFYVGGYLTAKHSMASQPNALGQLNAFIQAGDGKDAPGTIPFSN